MATSYRDLEKAGSIKRADGLKVRIQDLHEEPGLNLREEGEDLEASIDALAHHIANGGQIPPLEVRPRDDGGVWVVDGHRRRRAIAKLVANGEAVADKNGDVWVSVVAFSGNDVDRLARIMTSNESKLLTDLERANGYKRLAAFGLKPAEIAEKIGRSRPHVEQMLLLANANHDVQALVRAGKVSATSAIEMVRKHGEKAGAELGGKVKAAGGGRVREGDLKPKALPRTVVDEVVASLEYVSGALTKAQRTAVARAEKDPQHASEKVEIEAGTLLEIIKALHLVEAERARQAEKAAAKAAAAGQADIEDGEQEAA